jgi:hypothetical protein
VQKILLLQLLFIFCIVPAIANADYLTETDNLTSLVCIEDTIPESLTKHLIEKGINTTLLKLLFLKNREHKLFLFKSASQNEILLLLKNSDGTGILLLFDSTSPLNQEGEFITFDTLKNVHSMQLLSEECILQISDTIRFLLLAIYDCAIKLSRSCIDSFMGFFTNLFLIPSECRPYEEENVWW